jgi:ribosomal protein S8
MVDPIADMLTRIRNAIMARHDSVDIPYSNIKKRDTSGTIRPLLMRQGRSS